MLLQRRGTVNDHQNWFVAKRQPRFSWMLDFAWGTPWIPTVVWMALSAISTILLLIFLSTDTLLAILMLPWCAMLVVPPALKLRYNCSTMFLQAGYPIKAEVEEFFFLGLRKKTPSALTASALEGYWWAGLVQLGMIHQDLEERMVQKADLSAHRALVSTRNAVRRLYFDMIQKTEKFSAYFESAKKEERFRVLLEREFLEFHAAVLKARDAARDADFMALAIDVSSEVPPTAGELATEDVGSHNREMVEALMAMDIFSGRNQLAAGDPEPTADISEATFNTSEDSGPSGGLRQVIFREHLVGQHADRAHPSCPECRMATSKATG